MKVHMNEITSEAELDIQVVQGTILWQAVLNVVMKF
jgi:hypothetical protein